MKNEDFFNSPLYKQFNQRPTMDEFLSLSRRFCRFGLTDEEIKEAIQSACDFFHIPYPRMVQDLTNHPNGQTMFVNWDRGSFYDDVLCFNMQQLIDMKVDNKEAFSLVMTHECAHRVLQNTVLWTEQRGMGTRAVLRLLHGGEKWTVEHGCVENHHGADYDIGQYDPP